MSEAEALQHEINCQRNRANKAELRNEEVEQVLREKQRTIDRLANLIGKLKKEMKRAAHTK